MLLLEDFNKQREEIIDPILDKISKGGESSLSPHERRLLQASSEEDWEEFDRLTGTQRRIKSFIQYDPRADDEFSQAMKKEFDIDTNMPDEQYEEGQFRILWDELKHMEMRDFLEDAGISPAHNVQAKPWDKLGEVQGAFKKWVNQNFLDK